MWRDPAGEQLWTYTIITTDANEVVRPYHHRMPVILHREDESVWLDPSQRDLATLTALLRPYPAGAMREWRVSERVNRATDEGEKLIEPEDPPKAVPLF